MPSRLSWSSLAFRHLSPLLELFWWFHNQIHPREFPRLSIGGSCADTDRFKIIAVCIWNDKRRVQYFADDSLLGGHLYCLWTIMSSHKLQSESRSSTTRCFLPHISLGLLNRWGEDFTSTHSFQKCQIYSPHGQPVNYVRLRLGKWKMKVLEEKKSILCQYDEAAWVGITLELVTTIT